MFIVSEAETNSELRGLSVPFVRSHQVDPQCFSLALSGTNIVSQRTQWRSFLSPHLGGVSSFQYISGEDFAQRWMFSKWSDWVTVAATR